MNRFLENYIYLILLCLPTYLLRFTVFGIPFTLLEVMLLLLFVLFGMHIFRDRSFRRLSNLGQYKYIIAFFIIISLVSAIISLDNRAALGVLKAYIIEPILFFIVFINIKPNFSKVLTALGLGALFIAAIGLIQYFSGYGIPTPWNNRGEEFRITSVYEYPNAIGLFLSPIIVLFLGNILNLHKRIFFSLAVILLSFTAIILSVSQGAWLGVMIGLFFLGLFTKWRYFFIGGIIIAVIIVFLVPNLREIATFQDTSGDVRLALWQGTLNLIKDRPFFGAGLASFPHMYSEYKLAKHVELLLYPHNIFLNFWVELGLLGLLWLLWVLSRFFYLGFRHKNARTITIMAAMVAIIIYGLVDVPYFKNDLAILFWAILGLLETNFDKPV